MPSVSRSQRKKLRAVRACVDCGRLSERGEREGDTCGRWYTVRQRFIPYAAQQPISRVCYGLLLSNIRKHLERQGRSRARA